MKRINLLVLVTILALIFVGCSQGSNEDSSVDSGEDTVIRIGVTPEPHGTLVELIQEELEAEGITLEIEVFTDYVTPNLSLDSGDLDVNFMQHEPYLNNFNEENDTDLVSIGGIHIEPIGLYSSRYESIDEIEDGAEIAIPNDGTNGGRALLLLAENGLITLDEDAGILATENDIVENPKNLKITPLEAAQLPRVVDDVDGAIINGNFALEAGLVPTEDSILLEGKDSPYANIVAVRAGQENEEQFTKLLEALQSDKVKEYIEENYEGGVIPAF